MYLGKKSDENQRNCFCSLKPQSRPNLDNTRVCILILIFLNKLSRSQVDALRYVTKLAPSFKVLVNTIMLLSNFQARN